MRNSLKYGFTAIAFAFVITFAACDDKEILKRMEVHSKALKTLRADITVDRFYVQLGDHDISKGKLTYVPVRKKQLDALVRIDFISPQESIAFVNKKYVIYSPRLKQAIVGDVSKAKISPIVNEALAFMNASAKYLKANYQIKYLDPERIANDVLTSHLEFTPKVSKSYKKVEFWVDNTGTPIQVKIFDKSDDTTTISFSNIEKNVAIKGSVFKVELPKGTKMIKN